MVELTAIRPQIAISEGRYEPPTPVPPQSQSESGDIVDGESEPSDSRIENVVTEMQQRLDSVKESTPDNEREWSVGARIAQPQEK